MCEGKKARMLRENNITHKRIIFFVVRWRIGERGKKTCENDNEKRLKKERGQVWSEIALSAS